jgi:hypothetical protein
VFAILAYFANIWPAWGTSSAMLISHAFGGSAAVIAVVILVVVGLILTLAQIVHNISACTGGTMMFIYSALLIAINRKMLPKPHPHQRVPDRCPGLVVPAVRVLAVLTVQQQLGKLLGG